MKFCVFEAWDYMDPKPSKEVRSMDETKVEEYVAHMNLHYSGGTTKFDHIMDKMEADRHCRETIEQELKYWDSTSIEFIHNMLEQFYKCYIEEEK